MNRNLLDKMSAANPAFREDVHPLMMKKAVLMKLTMGQIADLFGIEPNTLVEWIKKNPDLAEAANFGKTADLDMVWSIYCAGVGIDPITLADTQKRDMRVAIFWVKSRLKWSDKPPEDKGTKDLKDMTPAEILKFADELTGKLEEIKGARPIEGSPIEDIAPPPGDPPPGSHFPEDRTDVDF